MILNFEQVDIAHFLKILFFVISNYYISIRIINHKECWNFKYKLIFLISAIIIACFCKFVRSVSYTTIIIYMIVSISIVYNIVTKSKLGYSILINIISASINIAIIFVSATIGYIFHVILNINNELIDLLIIFIIYLLIIKRLVNINRVKNGITILKRNKENEYFNMIILNISWVIILFTIFISEYKKGVTEKFGVGLIVSSILMFITIQKSLQLYYKQKMLVKDLEETKVELEDKKKEVEELEKENLNFSKISHSIAHKQKSLEFKLNELSMKSEISSEIGLKDRIEKLGKELTKETISVIGKTGIEEIDDMLKYMQSECVKNKIDFQLQISGNIYTMINHYIDKEELEILLADHIKNAIIAIGYGDNINKSILVRLGKLDGYYGLYIYDSGIEFEIETLYKLGKIPATTHKDNGGTGMGFMNTFDTLRKHKASFVIEEYGKPVKNNFTKALKFIFNQNNEFKIYSYRNEEIEKENKENNLLVEKLNI